jgi:uncharacterized protein YkwD
MKFFAFAMFFLAAAGPPGLAFAQKSRAAMPDLERATRAVVESTNALRRAQGLPGLATNAKLTGAAREFANFMARTDRYGHEADGHKPSQRARSHGYEYCLVAENIAYQYSSAGFGTVELADKLFEGWKESPPHLANLLERGVTEIGVAIARGERSGRYYAVQMFGRPRVKAC